MYVHVHCYPLSYDLVPCLSIHFLFLFLSLSPCFSCLLQKHLAIIRVTHLLSIMLPGTYMYLYIYCYPFSYDLAPCLSIHFLFPFLSVSLSLSLSFSLLQEHFAIMRVKHLLFIMLPDTHMYVCTCIVIPFRTI